MLLLQLDEDNRIPKYQQIRDQIRARIASRDLRPGEALPSTRQLAQSLGVHRTTVLTAYKELWSLGFIDLSQGACPRVRDRREVTAAADRSPASRIDWAATASAGASELDRTYHVYQAEAARQSDPKAINFCNMAIDSRVLPLDGFRTCLDRALRRHGKSLLGYGDQLGFEPLRAYIADRLKLHGITAATEEILITNGSQQALDLVFSLVAAPGRAVAVEAPTYNYVPPLLGYLGLRALPVPVRADGMDLDGLERILRRERPALVYTMPNFQNPTGVTTGPAHRERLLGLCEQAGVPLLEDGFEEEMKYSGKVILPIKSMDKNNIVIYCGTFSKVLFAGARVGWIVAPRDCIERLAAIRRFRELSGSMILQAAMEEFGRSGGYDRHVNRMHRLYRKRMQTAAAALRRYLPAAWVEWTEPDGGFLLWLRLRPPAAPDMDWPERLGRAGVQTLPGSQFFCAAPAEACLRLSIASLDEMEITEGIRRLAQALRPIYAGK